MISLGFLLLLLALWLVGLLLLWLLLWILLWCLTVLLLSLCFFLLLLCLANFGFGWIVAEVSPRTRVSELLYWSWVLGKMVTWVTILARLAMVLLMRKGRVL